MLSIAREKVVLAAATVKKFARPEPGGCPGFSCTGSAKCADRHCQAHLAREEEDFRLRGGVVSCVQRPDTEKAGWRS